MIGILLEMRQHSINISHVNSSLKFQSEMERIQIEILTCLFIPVSNCPKVPSGLFNSLDYKGVNPV